MNGLKGELMDEMMMEIAREYFASMGTEEKKEILHTFLDMLSPEEKGEVLELILSEFAGDKEMLKVIREFVNKKADK